jgi:hypothetical protein
MMLSLFFIIYLYAIIGMMIFNTNTDSYQNGSPYIANDYTDFTTFAGSLLLLF